MLPASRYANLDTAPLKVMAQLRGLSPHGDKDALVQLLVSQDKETDATGKLNEETCAEEPGSVNPKGDEAVSGDVDDGSWKVVGKNTSKRTAAKPEISILKDSEGVKDASSVEDMELQPVVIGRKHEAVPATEDVDPNIAEDIQDDPAVDLVKLETDVPVGEVSKKKRRRGKKCGKRVNKNKTTVDNDSASKQVEDGLTEAEVSRDVGDLDSVAKVSSTASTFVEEAPIIAPTVVEDNDVVGNDAALGLLEPEVTRDPIADRVDDDTEPVAEQLSSTAPTVVEEPTPGLEKSNEVEDETVKDIQASSTLEPEHTEHRLRNIQAPSSTDVKVSQSVNKGQNIRASPNRFTMLEVEAADDEDTATASKAIDSTGGSAPKKSRKRGKKGGKKMQKAAANKPQPKRFTHVACAAAVVGVLSVAVGVLIKFA